MSDPLWLVTFAYFSQRADVYVVAAEDAQAARERVAEMAAENRGRDGHFTKQAVLNSARVAAVSDGLHMTQDAEY